MAKTEQLTSADVSNYPLNPEIIRYLELYRKRTDKQKSDVRILDWGCGRGETVACLIAQGYTCHGVEINKDYLNNARPYCEENRIAFEQTFSVIGENGRTRYDDGTFDAIISDQVFEHVEDAAGVTREMFRITRPGGISFHRYPPWGVFKEPHLFMPCVHWLPKNRLRKAAISFWMALGIDPWTARFPDRKSRLNEYYTYSVRYTHFWLPSQTAKHFTNAGFQVKFVTVDNPRLTNIPVAGALSRIPGLRGVISWMLNTFIQTNIHATRPAA